MAVTRPQGCTPGQALGLTVACHMLGFSCVAPSLHACQPGQQCFLSTPCPPHILTPCLRASHCPSTPPTPTNHPPPLSLLQHKGLKKAKEVRTQLLDIMTQHKVPLISCGSDWDTVRKVGDLLVRGGGGGGRVGMKGG